MTEQLPADPAVPEPTDEAGLALAVGNALAAIAEAGDLAQLNPGPTQEAS